MSPPANFYNTEYSTRDISNYSLIDEVDFQKTWKQLDILESPTVNIEETDQCIQETTENYFDTGLNLDKVLKSHTASPVEPVSQPCQNGTGKERSGTARTALPKFGFVAMLQLAFGIPNLLEENRFLNKDIAQQVSERHKKKKRVSFAKVELHDKHLPYCRRNSLKQEFGHLHAPQCCNYKAEQALGKQEFLIRGNFIRDNTKRTTEQDFYFDPSKHSAEAHSLRQVQPLDFSLKDSQCPVLPLHLDSKSSTMDSITYHEKTSPGLRRPPPPADKEQSSLNFTPRPSIRPMPCQPIFTDDAIISPPPSAESTVTGENIEILKETTNCNVTSPGIKRESKTTAMSLHEPPIPTANLHEPPTANLHEPQPTAKLREPSIIPQIAVTSWTNEPAGSPISSLESCDSLKLPYIDDVTNRTGSFASSEDSGYGGDNPDFIDDFLVNMSDDSDDSESEDENDITFAERTLSVEGESEDECDGARTASSSSTVCCTSRRKDSIQESDHDSHSSSNVVRDSEEDSDTSSIVGDFYGPYVPFSGSEEDIKTLTILKRPKREPATQPKMWFNLKPPVEPAEATTDVQTKPASSETPFEVQEGYVNPFSKIRSDSIQLKPPSVLGRLVCDTKMVILPVRLAPRLAPDRFMFDTPSPDDLIRIRQAGVLS